MVHQDIKPENILAMAQGQLLMIKLCDFGAATKVDAGQTPGGTFDYSAPEAMLQEQHTYLQPAVDVWSLGMAVPCNQTLKRNKEKYMRFSVTSGHFFWVPNRSDTVHDFQLWSVDDYST